MSEKRGIDRLFEATWYTVYEDSYYQEIQRLVNNIVLYYMVELVKNRDNPAVVRSLALYKLHQLNEKMSKLDTDDEAQLSQYWYLNTVLEQLKENPESVKLTPPAEPPMGAPI